MIKKKKKIPEKEKNVWNFSTPYFSTIFDHRILLKLILQTMNMSENTLEKPM